MTGIYDFSAKGLDGADRTLSEFKGQVLLIVNTASKCGFTPQYTGLEALQRRFHERGFNVLGFPCNQFGQQEPGDAAEIQNFCATKYDVSFPMFAKVDVNGAKAHPLWVWLRSQKSGLLGDGIKWNFSKFLIDRAGQVVERFPPTTSPDSIAPKIELLLAAKV